jgi:O-antigen/teichoic acid export membrane protein
MSNVSKRLLGRGSIYTLASAAPMLTGILVTPLLTRSIDVVEYGRVALAIVIMQFLVGVLTLGLPVVITRHAFTEGSGEAGSRAIAISGSLVALVIAGSSGLSLGLAHVFLGNEVPLMIVWAIVAGGAWAGVVMAQAWALARDDSWLFVGLAYGVSLVGPTLGLFAVRLTAPNGQNYFSVVTVAIVVVNLIAMACLVRSGPVAFSRFEFVRSLRIGLPVIPHQLATGSGTGAAVLLASTLVGTEAGARSQIAILLGTVPLIIISAIGYAWTPIILRAPIEQVGSQLTETAREVAWIAALGGAAVAALAPWLLHILVPRTYDISQMVPLAAAVALSACVASVFLAHYQLVVMTGRTSMFAVLSPLALLLGSATSIPLVESLGLAAFGVGYVSTYVLLVVFTRWIARRVSPVRWRESVVIPPLVVAALCCTLGALLPWQDASGAVARWVLGITLAAGALYRLVAVLRGKGLEAAIPVPARGETQ